MNPSLTNSITLLGEKLLTDLLDTAYTTTQADSGWIKFAIDEASPATKAKNLNLREMTRLDGLVSSNYPISTNKTHYDEASKIEGINSILICPLGSVGNQLGQLVLLKNGVDGFSNSSREKLELLCDKALLTFENHKLLALANSNKDLETELKIAQDIQKSLIPKSIPYNGAFELSTLLHPAKAVGGDLYDYFQLDDNRLAIVIGDVTGKGISASLHMAEIKGIFQTLFQFDLSPQLLMQKANKAVNACFPRKAFVTITLLIIDKQKKELEYIRAGHCPLLYYSSNKQQARYLEDEGIGLGIINTATSDENFPLYAMPYEDGDCLLLFTDGFVEGEPKDRKGKGYDNLRLSFEKVAHKSALDIKRNVYKDLKTRTAREDGQDDLTMIVIKFNDAEKG